MVTIRIKTSLYSKHIDNIKHSPGELRFPDPHALLQVPKALTCCELSNTRLCTEL